MVQEAQPGRRGALNEAVSQRSSVVRSAGFLRRAWSCVACLFRIGPAPSAAHHTGTPFDLFLSASGAASIVYSLHESYARVLKRLRAALKEEGLEVPLEMDVCKRIRDEFGIGLSPCCVLCVYCPYLLLEAAVINSSAAGLLPLHVVVSQSGPQTTIHLVTPADSEIPAGLRIPFERFLRRAAQVLGRIGAGAAIPSAKPPDWPASGSNFGRRLPSHQ